MQHDAAGHIIADGQQRLRETEDHRRQEQAIRAAIESAYQGALADAGWVRCAIIRLRMWREIRREIRKLAPDEALYG